MSNSAPGAIANSTGIAGTYPASHLFPWQPQRRVFQEIQFPARQFLLLPIVDWYDLRRGRGHPTDLRQVGAFRRSLDQRSTLGSFGSSSNSLKLPGHSVTHDVTPFFSQTADGFTDGTKIAV